MRVYGSSKNAFLTMGLVMMMSFLGQTADAQTSFKRVSTEYIVALDDPNANSGNNAQQWGLWHP